VVRGRSGGRTLALNRDLVGAYSTAGGSWQRGPGAVYDRLAEVVLARSPIPVAGARVLDAGAGTGAASRAAVAAGAARVIAVDAAVGMLAFGAADRPPAATADLLALPLAAGAFDVAVASFSLNHVEDPAAGLRELARVTRPGGGIVASAYAADDTHPVKAAVEAALAARGWSSAPWLEELRTRVVPLLATLGGCAQALEAAGLAGEVDPVRVPFPDLTAQDLVGWRLGMAQHAPFADALEPEARRELVDDAVSRLPDPLPPLVRSILVLRAVSPSPAAPLA
jgi:ubiquinone/menaquinone biosynthesis C-methylase UbiE